IEDLRAYVRDFGVNLSEVHRGEAGVPDEDRWQFEELVSLAQHEDSDPIPRDWAAQRVLEEHDLGVMHGEYTMPGDFKNYGELLITLPGPKNPKAPGGRFDPIGEPFKVEGHFPEGNIIAWIRHNIRTDQDGQLFLFIEEIQSDWHQKGRRFGYDVLDETGYRKPKLSERSEARLYEIEREAQDLDNKIKDLQRQILKARRNNT